jgi:hypothetical protein
MCIQFYEMRYIVWRQAVVDVADTVQIVKNLVNI